MPSSGARPGPGAAAGRPAAQQYPAPSNPHQYPVSPPTYRRGESMSPASLATAIILAFVALAAIAAVLIVLLNR
ncbi:hypothetical protein GCM10023147_48900 [Tsukamurella soli]|uniref:Uncharacterized protein n=2 Tax=Tsukamurella soli TaxID=644556 RepID=A0ABP8KFI3_9ACTN